MKGDCFVYFKVKWLILSGGKVRNYFSLYFFVLFIFYLQKREVKF